MRVTFIALYDLYSNGIRGLHSYLEREGHEVQSVFYRLSTYTDEMYNEAEIDELVDVVKKTKPDLIGIGVKSPLFQLVKLLSGKLREKIGCKIIFGGAHATADPESCLPYCDYVCRGEGEIPLAALCNGETDVPGIYPNRPQCPTPDLNVLPLPYYGPNEHYVHVGKPQEILSPLNQGKVSIYSSRGCPYACTFCHESLLKKLYVNPMVTRRKTVDHVIEEIKHRQKVFPEFNEVSFPDAIFTRNTKWVNEFCEKVKPLNIRFRIFSHAIFADREMFKNLKDAGLLWMSFGIQSGSERIRQIFNRKESIEQILEASRICKEVGIVPRWDFIIFNPFDDGQSVYESRKLMHDLEGPCVIREFRMRFFPGTENTRQAIDAGVIPIEDVEGHKDQFGDWSYRYMKYE